MAVIAGIAVEVVIVGLEVDMSQGIFAEDPDIGFHDRFIIGIIQAKGLPVEAHQSHLRTQP